MIWPSLYLYIVKILLLLVIRMTFKIMASRTLNTHIFPLEKKANNLCVRLRAADMHRQTEIFIVITMYNENETLFIKTWKAVVRNIVNLCKCKKSQKWGQPDSWKNIVVCIVADGRQKVSELKLKLWLSFSRKCFIDSQSNASCSVYTGSLSGRDIQDFRECTGSFSSSF